MVTFEANHTSGNAHKLFKKIIKCGMHVMVPTFLSDTCHHDVY